MHEILATLENANPANILETPLTEENVHIFDLSENNKDFLEVGVVDVEAYNEFIFSTMKRNNKVIGIGKYNENRPPYAEFALFDDDGPPRTVHMGIDVFAPERTEIFSPFPGKVHSFHHNEGNGNYGPTLILEHEIDGVKFYTLYGHITLESIKKTEGETIEKGQRIAWLADYPENGNWPPHLHFQLITDMLEMKGDFPGTCAMEDRERFLKLCPDPNLVLRIPGL